MTPTYLEERRMTLDEAWAEAEAALPEGWVLDGFRRLYDEGHSSERWVARAVSPVPDDENFEGNAIALTIGNGDSPTAALHALSATLRAAVS